MHPLDLSQGQGAVSSFRTRCEYFPVSSSPASLLATVLKELPAPCPRILGAEDATSTGKRKFERLCGATATSKPGRGAFSGSVCGRDAASKPTGTYLRRLPGKGTGGGLRPHAEQMHQLAHILRRAGHKVKAHCVRRKILASTQCLANVLDQIIRVLEPNGNPDQVWR